MNPVGYRPQSKRLLEQVREVLRYRHYSLKTEQAYLYWIRFFVRWQSRDAPVEAMRHPRDMGSTEVTQFLTMLATERHVSVSTHDQALSASRFLYREVLAIDLPWLNDFQRPTYKQDNFRAICAGLARPNSTRVANRAFHIVKPNERLRASG
jgi:hypothetical protein